MLEQYRAEIDECDVNLIATLCRRLAVAERIAAYKLEQGLDLYQPEREAAILERLAGDPRNYPYGQQIKELYQSLFRVSREVQMEKMLPLNIVLIGFMGSGKTSIGQYLANVGGYEFVDVDLEIENRTRLSVPEIFSRFGERCFRDLEKEVVMAVPKDKRAIIACGGGTVIDTENVRYLKQLGKLIWLDASVETLYKRIQLQGGRPLAQDKTLEDFREMYYKRQEYYRSAADCRVDTENRDICALANRIMHMGAQLQNEIKPGL